MKRVFSSLNLAEVHHARNLLEAEGIRAFVRNEFLSGAMGEVPFDQCQPELWIAADQDSARAERVLREGLLWGRAKGSIWQCACGEIIEAQFTQCWRCGSEKSP
ncbi:MAG: DUF2007 domain-containing protein [Betaproteobacteria bacterium]|nr:DUF2007 domain-containing protein [Betaproteobacteria bacterium]